MDDDHDQYDDYKGSHQKNDHNMKLMLANHEGDVTELGQMSEEAEIVAKTSLVLKWRLLLYF